ncbi:MAG: NAD(P)-dependent dehydrogenase, short-chain alcohol dehydrogenase family [Pseudonocardia sp.]|nr:NAD(P)-dependent dehydrogenase, short-chain alcohol dehydrogenase family [Pseudonocardia sp.]
MEINGTAAIVSGGASGLGAATAAELAARGSTVFALDLPASTETATPVDGVRLVDADVTDAEQVAAAVAQAAGAGPPLRIVVNCAGVGWAGRVLSRNGPHDLDLFRKIIDINLVGTFNVLRLGAEAIAATEPLADDARGAVVNTASIAAFEGQVGQVGYAASKGGVVAMTLSAARDLAQFGIRVNTIAPGLVDTPMLATVGEEFRAELAAGVPFPKRLGRPADFAQLAMLLIEHDYLNGEVIRMDGALRMPPR